MNEGVSLPNHLYSYLLIVGAVLAGCADAPDGPVLEIGTEGRIQHVTPPEPEPGGYVVVNETRGIREVGGRAATHVAFPDVPANVTMTPSQDGGVRVWFRLGDQEACQVSEARDPEQGPTLVRHLLQEGDTVVARFSGDCAGEVLVRLVEKP